MDNQNVLVAGMDFCRDVRLRMGSKTIVTTNKNYDKSRTSTAEKMIQSSLQRTLILQLESDIKCKIPGGHCLRYCAVMHAAWLGVTVDHSLSSSYWSYKGRLANFAQVVLGLDPKAGKYRPSWARGICLGKDGSGHDVLGVGPDKVV